MSFTFGSFDSEAVGVIATLEQLPSLRGLQLETLDAPGTDGLFLGGTTLSSAQFVFDTIIQAGSADDAHAMRDEITLALDPARGEQWLAFDAAPGWRWRAIVSGVIEWDRLTWDPGAGFQLRGEIRFDALEAYGRLVTDETWTLPGPGTVEVTRAEGNARSFPTVEIAGVLSASETVTVSFTSAESTVVVVVDGPLLSDEVLRLDWDQFDFARWDGAVKVASVVRGMSSLDRPVLWPGEAVTVEVATTGSVSSVLVHANSRRQ